MSPALLAPLGLAALVAALIPLIIHIARRDDSRPVAFAALRWLDPRPRPQRRLTLDERRLLAARLVLIALLALFLARPALNGLTDDRAVVAVHPAVAAIPTVETGRGVWLAPGFPALTSPRPAAPADPVSLIRQLDAELSPDAPLEVVAPPVLNGVDAQRPVLSRRAVWTVAEAAVAAPAVAPPAPPALVVRHAPAAEGQVRWFRAAAFAWNAPAPDVGGPDQPLPRTARHLVWLVAEAPPQRVMDWVRQGGVVLISAQAQAQPARTGAPVAVWADAAGAALMTEERLGRGRVLRLTRPLTPAALPELLQADFPDRLADILAPPPAPTRVRAVDHAPLTGAAAWTRPPTDLRPWLAVLIALAFAVERWLATSRRRGVAP